MEENTEKNYDIQGEQEHQQSFRVEKKSQTFKIGKGKYNYDERYEMKKPEWYKDTLASEGQK